MKAPLHYLLFPLPGTLSLRNIRTLIKCYLLNKTFPDHLIYNCSHLEHFYSPFLFYIWHSLNYHQNSIYFTYFVIFLIKSGAPMKAEIFPVWFFYTRYIPYQTFKSCLLEGRERGSKGKIDAYFCKLYTF